MPLVYELLRSPEYRKSSGASLVLLGLKIHMLEVPDFYALDFPLNFTFMQLCINPTTSAFIRQLQTLLL